MSKRMMGPFTELSGLSVSESSGVEDMLDCMDRVRSVLEDNGCKCAGSDFIPNDTDWGADISELVCRAIPHEIYSQDLEWNQLVQIVSVKLDTLKAEIDSKGEVCAWIYEES